MTDHWVGMAHLSSHKNLDRIVGDVLRDVRRKKGYSQHILAERAGYHRNFIGQLERGEKSPSLRTLFDLVEALETTPSRFIRAIERRM